MMLAADILPAWQNPINAADVDNSGTVASIDALAILNALSRGGDELLAHAGYTTSSLDRSGVLADSGPSYLDVNGDQQVTTDDAQSVLDTLNDSAEAETTSVTIEIGDGVFVIYNPVTGELRTDSDLGITSLEIKSESGIFTGSPALNLGGPFDIDTDVKIFKLSESGFQDLTFGNVAQKGLSEEFVRRDLKIAGSHVRPSDWPADSDLWPEGRDLGLNSGKVTIRLDVTSLGLGPIDSINAGEEFYVRAMVQDIRAPSLVPDTNDGKMNAGVYAAYLDVLFDSDLAEVVGSIEYAAGFTNSKSGEISDGLINEVGAVSGSLTPSDQEEYELFRVRMKATGGGELVFEADPADVSPQHDVLLFGMGVPVEELDITYENSEALTVTDTAAAPDLVAFAKAIAATGAKFYGAFWCSACHAQQDLFEDGANFLPYVESSNPNGSQTQAAADAGITSYPTWVFADNTRAVGSQTLAFLSQKTGIPIPQSNQPFVAPIEDQDLLSGSPLLIALDGYDPNGGPLTYTVTSDNPSLVTPTVFTGNRSMRIDVQTFGEMVFQLFEDMAPRATNRIIELAEDGFYDGLTFHRILNDFVIQGGDPLGDGTGNSDLPDFDDQFHIDLQHNRTGLLSFAKTSDDTNNSQFFITEGDSRHLDFNHTIFGLLTEGEYVRDTISDTPASQSGIPNSPVTMNSVEIFDDIENGVMMLKAPEGTAGTANITVTVRDQDGHEYTETFEVTVTPDNRNGGPFLDDIPTITTSVDTPVTFQLIAQDVEGDDVTFSGINGTNVTLNVNATTGQVTATPKAGFIGEATATVRVRATDGSYTQDTYDSQQITILVLPGSPVVDLASGSDSGISNSDNITNLTNLQFVVSNVTDGALVELFADGTKIGEGTADGTSITITTASLSAQGDGDYEITARQTFDGETSEESDVLVVTLDQTDPGNLLSTPPTDAMSGVLIEYDAEHSEEGDPGFRYSLTGAPTGAAIDPQTGEFTWTPLASQAGTATFDIVVTDAAGNTNTQTVNLDVAQRELMRYRLAVTDLDGSSIDAIAAGESFLLKVYVEDIRGDAEGVFAAYVDVLYDQALVQLDGSLSYGSDFPNVRLGSIDTVGLIDEAGAVAGTDPLGSGEYLLWSIQLVAQSGGIADFSANPADDSPLHDSLLNGLDDPLLDDQIAFEGTSIEIVTATFAQDDEADAFEDNGPVRIFVLANDIAIPETAVLSITGVGDPGHGSAQVVDTPQGQAIEYEPDANFFGQDTFTYTIQDDSGNSSTATVTVNVVNVNDLPVAEDDQFTIAEDAGATDLNVLNNDSTLPDVGETLTITNVTPASNGVVTIANDGTRLRYTPNLNFNGTDTFTYTVNDGNGGTAQAEVTVTVTPVNDPPVAGADSRTINEDTSLTVSASDLLANDTAGGGETGQTLTIISVSGASVGTVALNGSTITYTPPANFSGTATFNYTVRDNGTTNGVADPKTAVGTVTVTVTPVNDPPTAADDTAVAQTGGAAILIDVLANDSIAPDTGETLSITNVSSPAEGTAQIVNGQISYTPPADFSGTDTFTYTISDGNGGEDTATVTVTVRNFVPGGISGLVAFDYANSGNLTEMAFSSLAGTMIRLNGVDAQGQSVDRMVRTSVDGSYQFAEVTPGTYTVTQVQPVFTVDGRDVSTVEAAQSMAKNSFTVELPAEGLNGGSLNFAEQRIDPKFALWEALSSSSSTGFYAAVHAEDGRLWTRHDTGWEDTEIVDIQFSDDMSTLTITIVDGDETQTATVSRNDHSRVKVIGREGQAHLIRFTGAQSAYNFQPVGSNGAEGEAARDQVFADGSW